MSNRIKTAFDGIYADDQLKSKTKKALSAVIEKSEHKNGAHWQRLVLAPVCLVFICALCFGIFSYNTEVSAISIDINPSLELGINQYGRVINEKSYNTDGEKLLESVSVKNMNYEEAVNTILDSKEAQKYMDNDSIVVVTVDSESEETSDELVKNLNECEFSDKNMYCMKNKATTTEEAHSYDISFGKYNAYLALKKYEPDLSVDDIKDLSMREIKNRIDSYENPADEASRKNNSSNEKCENPASASQGNNGNGKQNGKKHKNNCK